MPEPRIVAGLLLVLGPVLGLVPVAHPALIPVWSASRERHLAIVAAHRRAWWALNAGFGAATIATAAGLLVLALGVASAAGGVVLVPPAVTYAVGGVLWCAVLGIRSRVTPLLGDLAGAGSPTEPGEALLGAVQTGLFGGFVVATAAALVALGAGMLLSGTGAAPIAALEMLAGLGVLAWLLRTGDVIPAVLYVPTLVLGVALLLEVNP
jgi:hypothetical protein